VPTTQGSLSTSRRLASSGEEQQKRVQFSEVDPSRPGACR
jgi:hypothetical protein